MKYIGIFLLGLGMMGIVWFFRQLFKPKIIQRANKIISLKWILLVLSLISSAGGWYVYSGFGKIPVGGVALGVILGIRVLINEHTGRWS
jgi:hypothetical protein